MSPGNCIECGCHEGYLLVDQINIRTVGTDFLIISLAGPLYVCLLRHVYKHSR
jgi:hypothetical protein